jgi:hypothetical protein
MSFDAMTITNFKNCHMVFKDFVEVQTLHPSTTSLQTRTFYVE